MACIFCEIVAGRLPATVRYQDDGVLAFDDIHPAAPVHVLIVPKHHVPSLAAPEAAGEEMLGHLLSVAQRVAAELDLARTGYRVVINTGPNAGMAVDHVHLHLVGGRKLGAMG